MTFEEIASRFNIKSRSGDSVMAVCPCHADRKASLHISRGREGKTVLFCHACGKERTPEILKAVGLSKADLFESSARSGGSDWRSYVERQEKNTIEAVYHYTDTTGAYTFTKVRLTGKQMIIGRLFTDRGNTRLDIHGSFWRYNLEQGQSQKGSFYCADIRAYRQAIEDGQTVFFVEGEKDVNTLHAHGYAAITSGGTTSWDDALIPLFKGADLVIFADNDEKGIRLAGQVEKAVTGVVAAVKVIVPVPDIAKADISDWWKQGHTDAEFQKLVSSGGIEVREEEPQKPSGRRPDESILSRLREISPETYELSDLGNSRLFAEVFGGVLRYNPVAKSWFVYDGKRWKKDEGNMIAEQKAKALAVACSFYAQEIENAKTRKDYSAHAERMERRQTRKTFIEDARDHSYIDAEGMDADDYLLNVNNGVLRLTHGGYEFTGHNPDLLLSKVANVDYKPGVRCERWEQFICEVMQDDAGKVEYLQKLCGLCLSGDTSEEAMWFFYGATSRNGKSTLLEVLHSILGEYSETIRPETLYQKKNTDSRSPSADIAKLKGCRLVECSELPRGMLLDTALLKTLTGRDRISARFLGENEFRFTPKFKLLVNTNYLPVASDPTVFKSGRVKVIPFNRHFGERDQDKHLKDKLTTADARSGVLNWMLEGWKKYQKEGLYSPETVREATAAYEQSSDKVAMFIEDCMERAGKDSKLDNVYIRYTEWCLDNGLGKESKRTFKQALQAKGLIGDGHVLGVHTHGCVLGHTLT